MPSTRSMPFIIAVANQKGGVAKTTTVVSLGGALTNHNQEVLLIDLDAQANLTLALGVDPSRLRGAVTDVFFNSATPLSVSRQTDIPGLDLIPSNSGMDLAERFLPVRKNYETILRAGLRLPRQSNISEGSQAEQPTLPYDFIILDCPPLMGAVTINALAAADMLIIPSQPEYFSAHALRTMMLTIRQVRSQQNPSLTYRILVTMFDRRNRIHRQVNEQIRHAFAEGVFQTIIEIDTRLRESAVEGKPITHYRSPRRSTPSRSALQYDALAQELIALTKTHHPEMQFTSGKEAQEQSSTAMHLPESRTY
ncbi:MAG: ParA family protein [Anaerolineales bacterium]|nr:ParA family protein [Anaerolineales bacterium]